MVGFTDVLHKCMDNTAVVIATLEEMTQEGTHQCHIGDVLEKDGQVGYGKHYCTVRRLEGEKMTKHYFLAIALVSMGILILALALSIPLGDLSGGHNGECRSLTPTKTSRTNFPVDRPVIFPPQKYL